jgi:uncharacterized membrane protein
MPPSIMAFVFTPFASIGDVHGNFWSILICFAPRIGVGVVAAGLFILFRKIMNPDNKRVFSKYLIGAAVSSAIITAVVFIITYIIYTVALKATFEGRVAWIFVSVIFVALGAGFYFAFRKLATPDALSDIVSYGASAAAASMTNTVCVLGGIYLFFGPDYAEVMQMEYDALLGVIGLSVVTNGIPEAIVSVLCAYFIARTIMKRRKRGQL